MEEKDRAILNRIAEAQEKMVSIMEKPEDKLTKLLTLAALAAGVLGAGIFGIIQKISELFGG